MASFKEIVEGLPLLTELRSNRDEDIKKAINNVLRVRIAYDDGKDRVISRAKGKKERYILPVAYGLTKNGKRAIRAYQTAGSTKRGVPKWKFFLLDNIYQWNNGRKNFRKYADTLIRLGLNTTGDMHMPTLFAITPIGGMNVPVSKDSGEITAEPLSKNDIDPSVPQNVSSTSDVPDMRNTRSVGSLDNQGDGGYLYRKEVGGTDSTDTAPVKKTDVEPNYSASQSADAVSDRLSAQQGQDMADKPVMKNDIETPEAENGTESENGPQGALERMRDLTQRMNNLYKEDEEENGNA